MAEEPNTSLIVLYSLIFLFIVFIVLEQPQTTTLVTLPLIGNTESIPLTTTIIVAVAVLVIAGGAFLFYKKRLTKKEPEIPKPENLPELSTQLSSLELPKREGSLTEEDINKLFIEAEEPKIIPKKEQPQVREEAEEVKEEEEEAKVEKVKEERVINYKELKSLITNLLSKNYTHDSILKYLKSKGYSLTQIRRAINEINQDNLASYISQSKDLGINKNEMIKNLLAHGWSLEEIKKQL